MVKKSSSSQSSKFTTTWLSSRFQNSSKIVKNFAHCERISQQKQRWRPPRGSSGHAHKEGGSSCQETHNSGILQQTVPGSQTLDKVETSDRLKYFKQSFACTNFQNGNSRIYEEVNSTGGVGHLDRPNRRLFSCSNLPSISKISEISNQKRGFLILGTPFWCSNSNPRVYSDSEGGKTHSSSQEPQNASVSGRLASSATHKRTMSHRFPKLGKLVQELGWLINFQKSELVPTQKLNFLGYQFDLQRGLVFPTQKKLDWLKKSDCFHQKVFSLDSKKAHVAHSDISFLRKK